MLWIVSIFQWEFFRCASISWFEVVTQSVSDVFRLAHLRVFQSFFLKNTHDIWIQEKEELLGTFYKTGEVQKHLGYPESSHEVFDEN